MDRSLLEDVGADSNPLKACQAISTLESITRALWVESLTSNSSGDGDSSTFCNEALETILVKSLETTIGEKNFWFGGSLPSSSKYGENLCDRLLSIGLHLIDIMHIQDAEFAGFLINMAKFYETPLELTSRLLSNDERCIEILFILFKHSEFVEKSKSSLWQDVRLLFVEVFAQIRFDALVLLEWMQSEVMAIALINRILNDVNQPKNWVFWEKAFEKSNSSSHLETRAKTYSMVDPEPQSDDVILKISELVGEMIYDKDISFSRRESVYFEISPIQPMDASKENFIKMFSELKKKLVRDHLVHFKPEKVLEKIDSFLLNRCK